MPVNWGLCGIISETGPAEQRLAPFSFPFLVRPASSSQARRFRPGRREMIGYKTAQKAKKAAKAPKIVFDAFLGLDNTFIKGAPKNAVAGILRCKF